MRITKFGHACLLIEEHGVRLLTDSGDWNTPPDVSNLDAILITHEHGDHFDLSEVKRLLVDSPNAVVLTHAAVGKLLAAEGIPCTLIEDGATTTIKGVSLQSCGTTHEIIYGDVPQCQNTGYFIAEKLFIPGDALHDIPAKPVEILALPVGGPWMRLSDAIDYAKKLAPKIVFPIHDAMYIESYSEKLIPRIVGSQLEAADIAFRGLSAGSTAEF